MPSSAWRNEPRSPAFLTLSEVLRIHEDQLERYGGERGVRDIGLLQSAVSMPAAGFAGRFLHEDLFEMAAAHLFHIARNHPFVDGNKRTAVVCALVFLALNDPEIDASEDELVKMVRGVAQGRVRKDAVAQFLRSHARGRPHV